MPSGELLRRCRVFVTTHRMTAWQEDNRKLPVKVADITLSEIGNVDTGATMMKGDPLVVSALIGHAYINKARGCNCGGAIKALSPPAQWKDR